MRKFLAIICVLLTCQSASWAAFGAATAWDVRTTGSTANGAGFDSGVGSPGTDESQGAGVAITCTLTGTTTGTCSPAITSTTHGPGNFINIASGSGCSTGRFEILSQSGGVATFDHAMGSSTNVCVGVIGGSSLTLQDVATSSTNGNTIYMKSGTYTVTARTTITATETVAGYTSTHGDEIPGTSSCTTTNNPLITTSTNSVSPMILTNTAGSVIPNVYQCLHLTNTAATPAEALANGAHGIGVAVIGLTISGFTKAVDCDNGTYFDCAELMVSWTEISNSTVYAVTYNPVGGCYCAIINDSYIHDNAGTIACQAAIMLEAGPPGSLSMDRDIVTNNSASGVCAQTSTTVNIKDSVIAGSGQEGILTGVNSENYVGNSIIYGNTNHGINNAGSAYMFANWNAVGSNGSGDYSNVTPINSISLSANPFVNSAGGNYALNSTAGGGALLIGLGFPHLFPGGDSTGYPDVGAVQSPGGASSPSPYGSVQ